MKHIKTISEFHQFRELSKPEHPMISVIDVASVKQPGSDEPAALLLDFYVIAMKKVSGAKMKYGQQQFDFDEGLMSFMAPNQVFGVVPGKKDEEIKQSGWVLNIHRDFLWNTPLARTIKQYDFWDYSVNEALFLSEKEETTINHMYKMFSRNTDPTSINSASRLSSHRLKACLVMATGFTTASLSRAKNRVTRSWTACKN